MRRRRSTIAGLGAFMLLSGGWTLACGASATPNAGDAKAGAAVYQGTCIACHGADGKGVVPGTPNFTDPKGVLSLSNDTLEGRVIHGFQSSGSPMSMPPKGGNPSLTSKDVLNVLTYIRQNFGQQ